MTTWINTTRKARKSHRCESCWRTIGEGENYNRTACFDGGQASTYVECVHCRAFAAVAHNDLDPLHEGYGYDSFAEMECTSSAIAIMHGDWRQKWRNLDGTLMPIPTLELAVPA